MPGPHTRCDWCLELMGPGVRADAETCSQECRQARHRFRIEPCKEFAVTPMRFGIADPPYIGVAEKYYGEHDDYGGEVDHGELVVRMLDEYPDGWGLCMSSKSILEVSGIITTLAPKSTWKDFRWASWHKGPRNCVALHARDSWEPFLVYRGRERRMEPAEKLDNTLVWGGRQHSHPGALVGMKPAAFCEWAFRQLNAQRGDTMADIFPGSGAITRAWRYYAGEPVTQLTMFGPDPVEQRSSLPSRMGEATTVADRQLGRAESEEL